MLIEFSVANFRSFRERQTLSMAAAPRLGRKENAFSPSVEGEKLPDLLKTIAIYGPNASGKSNLLKALDVVSRITRRTPTAHVPTLPVTPFKFDRNLANKPSEFEIHFIRSGLRYSYEFAATPERIVWERLVAYPKGKESLLYQRGYDDGTESYVFGQLLLDEAGSEVVELWRKVTPPTVLYMAQAVANSSADMRVLRKPFEWLSTASMSLLDGAGMLMYSAQALIATGGARDLSSAIAEFLRELDVPVSKIVVADLKSEAPQLDFNDADDVTRPESFSDSRRGTLSPRNRYRTTLTHKTSLGEGDIDFEDESKGTRNLFGFWLPWITRDPDEQHARCILQIDEFDSSLHPLIVQALVERHTHASAASQLIFTTHDTHLMDTGLLRRDQIWLTERDSNGATQLRSVHDFKGRQSEDVEKRYFEGRYRGLPLTTKG